MSAASRQSGLSLVELMVTVTLGAIITAGLVNMFTGTSEANKLMQGQSRLQESGRFALDFLGRSIRRAGYKGCYSRNPGVGYTMNAEASIPYQARILSGSLAGQGGLVIYDADLTSPGWNPNPAGAGLSNAIINSAVTVTDIVTVRYASSQDAYLTADYIGDASPVQVQMPGAGSLDLAVNEYALINDCSAAAIFEVTGITENAPSAGNAQIAHAPTFPGNPAGNQSNNLTSNTDPRVPTFLSTGASVNAIYTDTFYVAPGSGVNNEGMTPLSLWRQTNADNAVELVEGVEDFQILLGYDLTGNRVPNQYVPATALTADMYANVVTARISVTVNSVDSVGGQTAPTIGCTTQNAGGTISLCYDGETIDGRLRRTFVQTIQLRNNG